MGVVDRCCLICHKLVKSAKICTVIETSSSDPSASGIVLFPARREMVPTSCKSAGVEAIYAESLWRC